MTNRAFLGSIGRINIDYGHTSQGCFVVYELSELIEAPIMLFASLDLLNRASLSETLEIFKDYQIRSVSGLRNQLFGDAMVRVSMESSLIARKFLQMSLSTLRATTLKICLDVINLGSNLLDLLSGERFSHRIDCDVLNTKINTKSIRWFGFLRLGNIDYNTEIEGTSFENEIGLTPNPVKPRSMVITNQNWKLDSTVESQQRDPVKSFPGHDSLIIDNSSIWRKFWFDRLISLIGFGCFGNCPNSHLSGDTKLFPNLMINNLLQFDFICCMKLKSILCNEVAGGIKLMHSLKESLGLLRRSFKFDLKSLHHSIDIKNL